MNFNLHKPMTHSFESLKIGDVFMRMTTANDIFSSDVGVLDWYDHYCMVVEVSLDPAKNVTGFVDLHTGKLYDGKVCKRQSLSRYNANVELSEF